MPTMELKIDSRNMLGEGVLWCEHTQRVYWTDIPAARLHAFTPADGSRQEWPMPERLATFALTADPGRLLLGLASRLAWFDLNSGEINTICQVEPELPATRVNDGRCDRQGRFVFGTINEAPDKTPIASFYRLNADLSLERLALPKVAISNSICFSPDGATMYFCDSLDGAISCCDYGAEVAKVRVFARLANGEPDGSAIDAEGCLWNAEWGNWRVVRYAPNGSIDRVLEVPVSQPSCVAIGGPGLNELFVTSAREGLSDAGPQAGGVFHSRIESVRGLPEVRFRLFPT
jgi:L-arabinonolactonase